MCVWEEGGSIINGHVIFCRYILVLLFANGTSLLALDEAGIRNSLDILVQCCKDWRVEINVAKSAVMHIKKKSERRNEIWYMVNGKEIPMVSSYKYLGCVLDEHLEFKDMVHDKVMSGKKSVGA